MMVEITEVNICKDKISITATNLEDIILAEDLFKEVEPEEVHFDFDRQANGAAAMKYLYRVVQSRRDLEQYNSLGEKLMKLCGAIVTIADSFRVDEDEEEEPKTKRK